MERYKIDNFLKSYPHRGFPKYLEMGDRFQRNVRSALSRKLGIDREDDGLSVLLEISKKSKFLTRIDCENIEFDLATALSKMRLKAPNCIYINWHRFDKIDRIKTAYFVEFFSDLWYPSVDDIEIFDQTLDWIISVNHEGIVTVWNSKGTV